jgi:hypothetical protein
LTQNHAEPVVSVLVGDALDHPGICQVAAGGGSTDACSRSATGVARYLRRVENILNFATTKSADASNYADAAPSLKEEPNMRSIPVS